MSKRILKPCVILMAILAASASLPALSAQVSQAQQANCDSVIAAQTNANATNAENAAKAAYIQIPPPTNLQDSSCFGNILNMGLGINGSLFDPSAILSAMRNAVCAAASNAIQWPISNITNQINSATNLPYGLGGSSISTNTSGQITATTTTSGSSAMGLSGAVGNTLSNGLGNYTNRIGNIPALSNISNHVNGTNYLNVLH